MGIRNKLTIKDTGILSILRLIDGKNSKLSGSLALLLAGDSKPVALFGHYDDVAAGAAWQDLSVADNMLYPQPTFCKGIPNMSF